MSRKKGLGVSPLTNTIFYGLMDTEKNMFVGNKVNVTDDAIAAVYTWFMENMEKSKDEREEYRVTYPGTNFELVMRRKNK